MPFIPFLKGGRRNPPLFLFVFILPRLSSSQRYRAVILPNIKKFSRKTNKKATNLLGIVEFFAILHNVSGTGEARALAVFRMRSMMKNKFGNVDFFAYLCSTKTTRNMKEFYSEVRCDYYDGDGFFTVDAWRTANDDEEVKVIAVIHSSGDVYYIEPEARISPMAQEVIKDMVEKIKKGDL